MSEEVDDSAFCPVCLECYSESGDAVPRLLPCTHTMCHACVDRLINKNTLMCPQDRKPHPAPSGATSFPQNKYILKMLKQNKKTAMPSGGNPCNMCEEHGMEVVLYCKHSDCQVGICPLCVTQHHRGHTVVNIEEPRKSVLKSKAVVIKQRLSLDLSRLVATRQKVHQQRLEIMEKVNQRSRELLKEFDTKITVIESNIKKLNEISQRKTDDMEKDDFEKNTGFIEKLQKQSEDEEPMKYKFYDDLEEITREMEPPGKATETKRPQHMIAVGSSLRLNSSGLSHVRGVTMLSNGSLIAYGSVSYVTGRILQYDWNTKDLTYSKDMDTKGAVEIRKGGDPYLLVSDGASTLKLLEISYLAKCCKIINKKSSKIEAFYLDSSDHLILEVSGSPAEQFPYGNSCGTNFLFYSKIDSISHLEMLLYRVPKDKKDMYVIRNQNTEKLSMTFFVASSRDISARDQDGLLLWSFSGAPTGMLRDIKPTSITADEEKQYLYVCDEANNCIQIISTGGVYLGRLVKMGEFGLGKPILARWYKDITSLLVVHSKSNESHVSILNITKQE